MVNRIPNDIDRLGVVFDDGSLVADAGLFVAGTLMSRLGLEQLLDETVRLGDRPGGAYPGRKVLSLVASMLVGGSHIDHADRLRAGSTDRVLPFLGDGPVHIGHVSSFVHMGSCPPDGQGPGGNTKKGSGPRVGVPTGALSLLMWIPLSVRCPPTPSTERPTGTPNSWDTTPWWRCGQRPQEILHSRLRGGSSQKGAAHFVVEAVNRVRRAGAAGPLTVRADSGFWSYRLIADLDRLRVEWSITIPQHSQVKTAIAAIEETAWKPIDYPKGGVAQVAETAITASRKGNRRRVRVVVRRTRLTDPAQAQLWPDWRYETSKPTPGCRTARPGTSSPTPPG